VEPWLSFYSPHFTPMEETETFVRTCENLQSSAPNHVAKIMMHQAQRLISIADDLPRIRPHKEPLQVMFLIMCSENIAKLHDGFSGEGKSRHYVQQFFSKFLSPPDKDTLSNGLTVNKDGLPPLGFDGAVNLLYDIRCSVAHEGIYTDFVFRDGYTSMVNTHPNVTAEISFIQIRDIVVRGCIRATTDKLLNA